MTRAYGIDEEYLREAEEGDDGAVEARARLERRIADQELIAFLSLSGFTGPGWEEGLAPDLARYGLSVLRVWISTGMIFLRCREKGLLLAPWVQPPTREETDDLAAMTVAQALRIFRNRALVGKGWDVAGGASLASWFIGCCIFVFPNQWREWNGERERVARGDACAVLSEGGRLPAPDPAVVVSDRDHAFAELRELDEASRRIVALTAEGYSQDEIAEVIGISVRALEGRLHRIRKGKKNGKGEV